MNNNKGFTMIEIIAVMTITAILAAIAIPSAAGYVSDSLYSRHQVAAQSLYAATKNEEAKFLIANGVHDIQEVYDNNPQLYQNIMISLNNRFDDLGMSIAALEYYGSATSSGGVAIPADSYLMNFFDGEEQLKVLISGNDQIKFLNQGLVFPDPVLSPTTTKKDKEDKVKEDKVKDEPSGEISNSDGDSNQDTSLEDGTPADEPDSLAQVETKIGEDSPGDPDTIGENDLNPLLAPAIDMTYYSQIRAGLTGKYSNDKKWTEALQQYILYKDGYQELTPAQKSLINVSEQTKMYWIPFVDTDQGDFNIFLAASTVATTSDAYSTLVYLDGYYYAYVNNVNSRTGNIIEAKIDKFGNSYGELLNLADQANNSDPHWMKLVKATT